MAPVSLSASASWREVVHASLAPWRRSGSDHRAAVARFGRQRATLEDGECAAGELCALGHCVLQPNAACRSRRDCRERDALCALSGYTGNDPHSNSDMRAYCLSSSGGAAQL